MSINYHAYQCRDYLLSGFEEIKKQWEADFTDYDPERISRLLGLSYDDTHLYIHYFGNEFRLSLKDGHLEKKTGKDTIETDPVTFLPYEKGYTGNLGFNEAMSVYHILKFTKDFTRQKGNFVPNESLDPRATRKNTKELLLLDDFAKLFSERLSDLDAACRKMGGKEIPSRADLSYEFMAFPQIPLRLLFWDGDDEFAARASVLVSEHVTDYVHPETTGCMVSDLFELLKKTDEELRHD